MFVSGYGSGCGQQENKEEAHIFCQRPRGLATGGTGAAIRSAGVKARRLLFVFAASVPERVTATVLAIESAELLVVKSIGSFDFYCSRLLSVPSNSLSI